LVLSTRLNANFINPATQGKLNGKQEADIRPPACAAPATVNVMFVSKGSDASPIPA